MELVLTSEDVAKINELIQITPFKYAMPFFQFFQAKIQENMHRESDSENKNN